MFRESFNQNTDFTNDFGELLDKVLDPTEDNIKVFRNKSNGWEYLKVKNKNEVFYYVANNLSDKLINEYSDQLKNAGYTLRIKRTHRLTWKQP